MAKAKKTPKEASNLFHNIMKASVHGNPKPIKNNDTWKKIESIEDIFNLRVGGRLLKYKGKSIPKDSPTPCNETDYFCYLIENIINETGNVDLKNISPMPKQIKMGLLHQTFQKLIDDGTWWY